MSARGPAPAPAVALPRLGSGAMFDAIAARYDLLNRVLSVGTDVGWRRRAVRSLMLAEGARVLDVATGTADVAIEVARRHPSATVLGVDPSAGMLEVARSKVERLGLAAAPSRVELCLGEAERLPLADASVDAVTIAFGIRNVADRPAALAEMCRVTKPGGVLVVLELTEPDGRVLGSLARLWIHRVVPAIGAALSGKKEYGYLQRSIAAFPPPDEFASMVRRAGWRVVRIEPLTLGAAHLFVARRPA